MKLAFKPSFIRRSVAIPPSHSPSSKRISAGLVFDGAFCNAWHVIMRRILGVEIG